MKRTRMELWLWVSAMAMGRALGLAMDLDDMKMVQAIYSSTAAMIDNER